jgi:hypothetical protein
MEQTDLRSDKAAGRGVIFGRATGIQVTSDLSNPSIPYPVFILFGVVVILAVVWHFARAQSAIRKWAAVNEYQIIQIESPNFREKPFSKPGSSKQVDYFVKLRTSDGRERSCWIRCGGRWTGTLTDETEVIWDDAGC